MGQTLVSLISHNRDFDLLGGIDKERKVGGDAARYGFRTIETAETAADMLQECDVLLDFSAVAGLQNLPATVTHAASSLGARSGTRLPATR